MSKFKEKEKAINLRKKGLSYSEILKEIPVAKSTLSLWLRSVGLSKQQKQKLTQKKLAAALRGAMARRNYRLFITEKIKNKAKNEIRELSNRELWLIGIALYWAEGSKEKVRSPLVEFTNSDPYMIKLFLSWLFHIIKLNPERIKFEIYIHENSKNKLLKVKKHWAKTTNFSLNSFETIYFKKHKIKTKRKNIGDDYYGILKIRVKKSSSLNRQIAGWIEGINNHCRVV